ncbi:transcription initiation factor IIB [[Candida] railenensis]|uniref:Transcription initiation factor IIB n=1 Tax=[Candida] railenensis TaxID=45579 RepID=A0A9P0QWA8_9ASCO|nr:transcription initiation factor IIB [[Candida] railenensis]
MNETDKGQPFLGPNLNVTLTCPDCKIHPPDWIERFSDGDIVCGNCGLVLSERIIDTRSEWRTFSNDDQNGEDPSRVGNAGNPLFDSEDLSTLISHVRGKNNRELNRAQLKSDKKDITLSVAYAKISQLCDGYQLPKNVQDNAKEVYKLVYEERSLRGKSQEAIMAAAILIGCRKASVARTYKEISALTNVSPREFGKVVIITNKILQEKNELIPSNYSIQDNMHTTQTLAEDLIKRFCSHLGLSSEVTHAAEYIAMKVKETGVLAGRSPDTIAATVIYMAATVFGTDLSPSKIAEKTGVSDGTIKTSYKVMYEERQKLIDPLWTESGKLN